MRALVVLLVMVFMPLVSTQAQEPSKKGPGPNVEIWLPPDFRNGDGPWPLIIFSHGFGGCAKQSQFLTSYLADEGYIVAAPDHEDARPCLQAASEGRLMAQGIRPEKPLRFPEQWTDKTEADRRDDILFTLQSLEDDPKFEGVMDLENIGLIGHSLGGYTVLGMAGAWPSWKDSRFKVVVALSPYVGPFVSKKTLKHIDVPVMYQGGTHDKAVTPLIKSKVYHETPASKYFVELDGAGHDAWTQKETRWREPINRTALSFFDRYLKGKTGGVLPTKSDKLVKTYWAQE